jgi:mono/diheme cytochrome c family protein
VHHFAACGPSIRPKNDDRHEVGELPGGREIRLRKPTYRRYNPTLLKSLQLGNDLHLLQFLEKSMVWSNTASNPACVSRPDHASCSFWLWTGVLVVFMLSMQSLSAADIPEGVKGFFEKHCLACHDQQSKKGGLDLTPQSVNLSDVPTFLRWVRLHDRVQSGEMPPKDSERPKAEEIQPVIEWLSASLNAEENQRREKNGRSVVRRMNRTEFENTLRDLLDVPWVEVRDMLPDDGRAGGYTKTAVALDVSPVMLAKYAEAIDKALAAAVAKWSVPPEVERLTLYANQQYDFKVLMSGGDAVMLTPEMKYDDSRFPMPSATNADGDYPEKNWSFGGKYKDLGEAERDGVFKDGCTVGMTRTFGESFGGRFNFAPVHPGRYQIGVSAWSYWWDKGEVKPSPRSGSVGVYCGSRLLGFVDAPSMKPTYTELHVDISPTEENHLRAAGTSFLDAHVYFSQGQIKAYSGAGVAIDKLTVVGPLYDEWPPTSHRRLFGSLPIVPFAKLSPNVPRPARPTAFRQARGAINGPGRLVPGTTISDDPPGDARRLLSVFLPRAFRRPVSDAEIQRYAAIVDARIHEGASFEDSMLEAYRTALLSPDYLFLNEPTRTLDGYAIATRLSYVLWNSCPDDALFAAAKAGTLTDPQSLRSETDRMLGDPKAERFFQDFPDQWLDLRDFDLTSPDKQLYPEFQPYLEDAMRREPREFFKFAIHNGLPMSHLFSTSINIVNQRLAEHYGIASVEGTRFRRVDVDQSSNTRGGFLTMAAVCKVTANGSTTSPVKRGAWVMKKILGQPPQAPPPDIPAIEPDVKGTTTIREQLAKHREDTACAGCHAKFDPPGFALESYDVIGGWRDFYRATEGAKAPDFKRIFRSYLTPEEEFRNHVSFRDGQPVDSSGELVDGRKFAALREYQALLNSELPAISRNLANQFVVYSTGAPVSFTDRPAVEEILKRAGGTNANVRELLHQVIQSPLFMNK